MDFVDDTDIRYGYFQHMLNMCLFIYIYMIIINMYIYIYIFIKMGIPKLIAGLNLDNDDKSMAFWGTVKLRIFIIYLYT